MARRALALVMCVALVGGCHWWQRGLIAATAGVAGGYGLSTLAHCDPNDSTCSVSANQNALFVVGVISALGFWGLGEMINSFGADQVPDDVYLGDGDGSSGGDGSSANGSSGDGSGSSGSGDGSGSAGGGSGSAGGGSAPTGCPCGHCGGDKWQPVC